MIERVFLDMDGVIADFISPSMAFHGSRFDAATYPKREWLIWKVIGCTEQEFWKFDSRDFWANLPVYPWARELVEGLEGRVGQSNICLLTSPSANGVSVDGKRSWIAKHFPAYSRQVLFGSPKHFCAHRSTVLIDDSDANCKAFADAGGHWLTFPRVWNEGGERTNPVRDTLETFDLLTLEVAA